MLSLIELNDFIKEKMYALNADDAITYKNTIERSLAGELVSKNILISSIKKIIKASIKEKKYKEIITEYHINYFQPIYTGTLKSVANIINKNILNDNSDYEELLDKLTQIVYQELYGLSVIDEYSYGISGINEISCNTSTFITMQIYGKKIAMPNLIFENKECYEKIVKKSISFNTKNDLTENCPEVLCERITGDILTVLMPPYSKEFSLNIKYSSIPFINSQDLIELGTSTQEIETTIDTLLPGRPNIVIIGDQGVGKTTYILRLLGSVSKDRAIATIEPRFELNPDTYFPDKDIKKFQLIPGIKSAENTFETCLNLNRNLIVNGEIRNHEEALLQLKAWTRLARGSMGTFLTTSINDYVFDLKNLLMQSGSYFSEYSALYDIARATDIVIQFDIDREVGTRYISEIAEIIVDNDNEKVPFKINTLFKYNKEKQKTEKVGKIQDGLINRCKQYEFSDANLKALKDLDIY